MELIVKFLMHCALNLQHVFLVFFYDILMEVGLHTRKTTFYPLYIFPYRLP